MEQKFSKRFSIRRRLSVSAATLLLFPLGAISSAWGQRPPMPPPNPPRGNQPPLQQPVDPRRVVRVDAPVIELPGNTGVDLSKPLVVAGRGAYGGRVRVVVKGEWKLPRLSKARKSTLNDSSVRVNSQGGWKTDPISLNIPSNAQDIRFEISAVQSIGNKTSETTKINARPALKVMHAPPTIMIAPTASPTIAITFPQKGRGSAPTALPDKTGKIALKGTAVGDSALNVEIKKTVVSTRRRWLPGGGHNLFEKYNIYTRSEETLRDIPIKNGSWNTTISMTPGKVEGTVAEVSVEVTVRLKNNTRIRDTAYLKTAY